MAEASCRQGNTAICVPDSTETMGESLCDQHHEHGPDAVHVNHEMARILQADAQETYEQTHTREEWMERIGRNYKL